MTEHISNAEFTAVLEDTFGRGQELIFTPSGRSMLPMLDGKTDKVTFSPKPARDKIKRFDVLFYVRPKTKQLVLHRLVGFDKDGGYVFSGDGQYYFERGIKYDDVIAIMSSFTHKGRQRSVSELSYKLYIRAMMFRKLLRMAIGKFKRFLKGSK